MEPPAAKRRREDAVAPTPGSPFVAASSFQGRRDGYIFTTGPAGTGYYAEGGSGGGGGGSQPAPRGGAPLDSAALLAQAEEAAGAGGDVELDVRAVRRWVVSLERALQANLAARVKYGADAPEKFVDSEVDLHEELQRLGSLAAAPELYPELVRLGCVPTLLSLLAHDNADIAGDAAEVLWELTDGDAVQESDEALAGGAVLGTAILEADGLPAILGALARFDDTVAEEAAAAQGLLNILENLVDISGSLRDAVVAHPPVLPMLLDRIGRKGPVEEGRVYAAELLAILLSGSEAAATALGAVNGVDRLLRAMAPLRKANKAGGVGAEGALEEEFVQNCFDCLCSAVMVEANRLNFVENEGVELMLLIIRAKGPARTAALKALDFALLRCPPAAEHLVDAAGLGTVFSAYAGRSATAARKKRGAEAAEEEEQRAVSLVAALLTLLPPGERRNRVAAKFVEDGHAKVDRTVELWLKYAQRAAAAERALAEEEADGEEGEDEERYVRRLDGGLFTLQQVALILGQLWWLGHEDINARMLRGLTMGQASLADVRAVLREYATNLGDEGADGGDEVASMRRMVLGIADAVYAPGEQRTPRREDEADDAAEMEAEEPEHPEADGDDGEPEADAEP